jgi:hypothetical protein
MKQDHYSSINGLPLILKYSDLNKIIHNKKNFTKIE